MLLKLKLKDPPLHCDMKIAKFTWFWPLFCDFSNQFIASSLTNSDSAPMISWILEMVDCNPGWYFFLSNGRSS
jgi:hypothetical protein